MADEQEKPKTTKTLTTTDQDAEIQPQAGPRFVPSGITNPQYAESRLRRWEVYQAETIRIGMSNLGFESADAITVTDENHAKMSEWLTTCLVGTGITLFRPGVRGINQVMTDVDRGELAAALAKCCELSGVFS